MKKLTKKNSFCNLHFVIINTLYVIACTIIMILIDSYEWLNNLGSWLIGWIMALVFAYIIAPLQKHES